MGQGHQIYTIARTKGCYDNLARCCIALLQIFQAKENSTAIE